MRKSNYLVFVVALIFTCSNAFAQATIFMKAMDGTTKLNGGSTQEKHVDEIEVLSNSLGLQTCVTCNVSGGGGVGKPTISSFNVMIDISAATISLKRLLLIGKPLTSVDVSYLKRGATPFTYYKIHMEDVFVESVQESASSESPIFAVSLVPRRIAWQRIGQNPDGSAGKKIDVGWDQTTNELWTYLFK